VFAATQKQGPNGIPWFDFYKTERRIAVYYFYLWDEQFGPCFIKVASYFPFPLKIWVNGHERAKRRCLAEGVGFTALSNGFASCADPPALQAIWAGPGHHQRVLRPLVTPAAAAAGSSRPGRRLLVAAVDAPDRDLPHPGAR
jgi:hypothetical protein